jgi:hypothetical protein
MEDQKGLVFVGGLYRSITILANPNSAQHLLYLASD